MAKINKSIEEKPATKRGRPRNKNLAPPFTKGCKPGPGRPKLSAIELEARHASRVEISEWFQALKGLTLKELSAVAKNPKTPAIRVMFARAIAEGIRKGDLSEIHRMYDRILGKPRQAVELSGPHGGPVEIDTAKYQARVKDIIRQNKSPEK